MKAAIALTQAPTRSPARKVGRTVAIAIAFGALALAGSGAQAQSHGGFHGGGFHGGGFHGGGHFRGGGWGAGPFWGIVGLGIGLGLADTYYYDRPDYVVLPPPVYYPPGPAVVYPSSLPPAAPVAAPMADPIFYPRNGQPAAQIEADRQACNRWATTQPRAMADGSVFQRATLACMDGRGYTSR